MPFRDPEDKVRAMRDWRRRTHTPAYMRWLNQRRSHRRWVGDVMQDAAERAIAAPNGYAAELVLRAALDEVRARERALGNRYDHDLDRAYYDESPQRPGPKAAARSRAARRGAARAAS